MFSELFNLLGGATRMNHPFVNEARARWQQNPTAAALWCRWYWQYIPPEVVGQAAQMAQQAEAYRSHMQVQSEVNSQLGALGISPSYSPGFAPGVGADPDEAIFMATLAAILVHGGNPPADPRVASVAERVLRNEINPLDILRVGMPAEARPTFEFAVQMLGDFRPMLTLQGMLMAALALPGERIPSLLGIREPEQRAGARRSYEVKYEESIGQVKRLIAESDLDAAQERILAALRAAEKTPGRDDDLEAVQYAVLLAVRGQVKPDVLRLALRVTVALLRDEVHPCDAATLLANISLLVEAHGLARELDPSVLDALQVALEMDLPSPTLVQLGLRAAQTCLRNGDNSSAAGFLDDVEHHAQTDDERLDIELARADIGWGSADRAGASEDLAEAIEQSSEASSEKVVSAIQKLLCLWPDEKPGVDAWVAEMETRLDDVEEPNRTMLRLTALLALGRAGQAQAFRRLKKDIDLVTLRRHAPASLCPLLDGIEQCVRLFSDHEDARSRG